MHGQTLHLGNSFLIVKLCAIGESTIDDITGNVESSRCGKMADLVGHSKETVKVFARDMGVKTSV